MLNRLLHIAIFCLSLAATASAQTYLQGTLSGGSPAPGPKTRSPLNSMERAANNLPGVTIVTDTFGNQRLAYYVRVLDSCVNYNPLTFVGAMPPSCFVYQCGTQDSLFYIDWKGDVVFVGAGGACDEDWLQISDNTCPDAITDSIYHYKYAAVGARLVWPSAEFLVNDSLAAAVQIIAGDRNARLGLYDNQNQVWSTIDQSGVSTLWYFNPTGEMRWVTAGGGTPQSPGAPFVNQFAIDPNDTPLPTVQAYLYPNTRTDTNTVENFIYTDPVGKFRSRPIDSLVQIVVDSIAGDSTLQANWYTTNGVTTDLGRVAYIKRSAWWRGLDSIGFIRFTMRPNLFDGPQFTIWQDSIEVDADTIAWRSTYHPELQFHNLEAEGTYFYADSLKVVGIGQFPIFPNTANDGTEKGFLYDGLSGYVTIINGDGVSGQYTKFNQSQTAISLTSREINTNSNSANISAQYDGSINLAILDFNLQNNASQFPILSIVAQTNDSTVGPNYFYVFEQGTISDASLYLGMSQVNNSVYEGERAFGIRTYLNEIVNFDWIQSYLPNDTTGNEVSFYNRAYYWKNEHPSGAVGDTLFHYWAEDGVNAGKNPGFITLDQICDHCSESAVNIYNSNGTTTDNTRIADVLETITWRSDDAAVDGIFPFRFELDDETVNEPEMMVWKFPDDSLTLAQSDQEIFFRSTNQLLLRADEQFSVWADSFFYLVGGGTAFTVTKYNQITQFGAAGSKKDYIANQSITGTAQTELFLDGSSAVLTLPANSNNNFEIHVTAICSNAGNGVGISAGDSWGSWYLGDIKRVVNTTTLVGVTTPATAQADASMSTSVVTIDANDTNDSLRIRFTPPSTAGTTTVIKVVATIELAQISY